MKQLIFAATLLSVAFSVNAQPGKPATKPPLAKPVVPLLKTTLDSINYILGESTGYQLQSLNFGDVKLSTTLFNRGLTDIMYKKKPLLDNNTINTTLSEIYKKKKSGQPFIAKATPKPATAVLKTTLDSLSYVLGSNIAYHFSQQGFDGFKFNLPLYNRGMNDILGKKKPLLDDVLANATINAYYFKMQEEKSKVQIQAGEKFLAQNKMRDGVKTTESGLQYEVLQEGSGNKMTLTDTFVCHYRGTFIDGQEFESSYNSGQPLTMPVNQVIQGWIEGLQLMSKGSKYKLYIPYKMAYGVMGQGQIPGGATLIFELELLDIKPFRENPNVAQSKSFLEQNKLRPEVKTTASGLQYEILREGTGPKMTSPLDTFVCHYRGTLLDGTEFDASYNRGQPLMMKANQVIKGWTETLMMMPVGSKYKIYVPSELGYGPRGMGSIPGGAALIFEMELLDFKPFKQ
ncbi:MAG: FKBP-type peptidyl-prolyl cis-trans isomerase [Chitinophagaceae bacterium]|nr:FKBP-type peptidyl-prolyl cis-trans isomerase [Chitinophagaceae bacterium]